MTDAGVPQFGERDPELAYRDRPSAFGLWRGADGRIAVVRIARENGTFDHDLPGGALDPGETDAQALVREFREETGLAILPGALVGRADQYVPNHTSGPVNNRCGFYEVLAATLAGPIQEPDHELIWLDPAEAPGLMYKGSAAWAIRRWLGVPG